MACTLRHRFEFPFISFLGNLTNISEHQNYQTFESYRLSGFMSFVQMSKKGISHQRLRHCAFSHEEDANLRRLVDQYGTDSWFEVSQEMVRRSARQCRERWRVLTTRELSLRPWTEDEDKLLIQKYFELGPKWQIMESFFTDRNSLSLKNRWTVLNQRAAASATSGPSPVAAAREPQQLKADSPADAWDEWLCDDAETPFDLFGHEDGEIWEMISLPESGYWE